MSGEPVIERDRWDRPVNSGPRPCLFDVGFPLSGSKTGLTPPISTSVPGTPQLGYAKLIFAAGGSSLNRCSSSIRARLHVRRAPFSPSRFIDSSMVSVSPDVDRGGDKTRIVYCKDSNRRGTYEHVSLGRAGARCRRCRRSVSPTRPPNRTCPFLCIRLSTGHAVADRDAGVMQRRFPVEWWLVLWPWSSPRARGCGGRDSDIGSLEPRRATRASCLRGWSSRAPSIVA